MREWYVCMREWCVCERVMCVWESDVCRSQWYVCVREWYVYMREWCVCERVMCAGKSDVCVREWRVCERKKCVREKNVCMREWCVCVSESDVCVWGKDVTEPEGDRWGLIGLEMIGGEESHVTYSGLCHQRWSLEEEPKWETETERDIDKYGHRMHIFWLMCWYLPCLPGLQLFLFLWT